MLDEHKYIDKETYDIVEKPMVFVVDSRFANIISILNKKGYCTREFDISCVEKAITFSIMLNKIFKGNVIDNSVDEKTVKYILMYGSGGMFINCDNIKNIPTPEKFYTL